MGPAYISYQQGHQHLMNTYMSRCARLNCPRESSVSA